MNSFKTIRVPSKLPIAPASCHGMPSSTPRARKTHPNIICMLKPGWPNQAANRTEQGV
jgi:hypothetical protein